MLYLLNIADDGALRHLSNGLDVSNGEGCLPASIDGLHGASTVQSERHPLNTEASEMRTHHDAKAGPYGGAHLARVEAFGGNEELLLKPITDRIPEGHLHFMQISWLLVSGQRQQGIAGFPCTWCVIDPSCDIPLLMVLHDLGHG